MPRSSDEPLAPTPSGAQGGGRYRYALWRRWSDAPARVFILLNPSTADAATDDPTIRACVRHARHDGAGAIRVVNLFARRATDPRDLKQARSPIGPGNDDELRATLALASANDVPVWLGWGNHAFAGRDRAVLDMIRESEVHAYALALNKSGAPRHPLYIKTGARPVAFA